jgi:inosine/xanthosine triphosphate pyrophosphatase family protein
MAVDWKNDINKLTKEAETELKNAKELNLDNDQITVVNDTKRIVNEINSKPSIYVHNYDLISSLLSDNIKKLKKFK